VIRTFTVAERRARLGVRHHLAVPAADVTVAATDLVGLHASDPTTPYLAGGARVVGLTVPDVERALYDARSLIRIVGMRRTLFVVPPALGEVIDAACTRPLGPPQRTLLTGMLEAQGVTDDGRRWIARVEEATLAALDARGEATARELASDVPDLGVKLRFGEGRGRRTSGFRLASCFSSPPKVASSAPGHWARGSPASTAGPGWSHGSAHHSRRATPPRHAPS
jgi:hypothetical protein